MNVLSFFENLKYLYGNLLNYISCLVYALKRWKDRKNSIFQIDEIDYDAEVYMFKNYDYRLHISKNV